MMNLTANIAAEQWTSRWARIRWELRHWLRARGLATLTLLLLMGITGWLHLESRSARRETRASQVELRRLRALPQVHTQARPLLELRQFHEQFPIGVASANQALEKLFVLAKAANLNLESGDYGIPTESGEQLSRYTISLPVVGDYRAIQQFCGQALLALPTLALDGVKFSRSKVSDVQVEATLNFSFYFRSLP